MTEKIVAFDKKGSSDASVEPLQTDEFRRGLRSESGFIGPVFIVGMPRSGTKLLRALLNQNPGVGIARIETHFLPYWTKNWEKYGDLSDPQIFRKFYQEAMNLPYFMYMSERGALIGEETWYSMCRRHTPSGVFEALIRHDAEVEYGTDKIWGDKTPDYISHMELLKELFPEARFIHIIRDVRDYCLSVKKAWGKSMLRAAQRWCDDILKIRAASAKFPEDYLEVRYEELLAEPEAVLKRICDFLEVEYDPRMTQLSRPTENLGDAKGWSGIKKDNAGKYRHLMDIGLRKEIEAIAAPLLRQLGYLVEYQGNQKKIGRVKMLFYEFADGLMLFRYRMRERGAFKAMKWSFSFKKLNV